MCKTTTRPKSLLMSTNQLSSKQTTDTATLQPTQKVPDKPAKLWLLGAFISAVGATFCCLPALLFLLFGSSFGLVAVFTSLEALRPILSGLALLSFAVYVWARFFRKQCALRHRLTLRSLCFIVLLFLGLMLLLFYPEILGLWYSYE